MKFWVQTMIKTGRKRRVFGKTRIHCRFVLHFLCFKGGFRTVSHFFPFWTKKSPTLKRATEMNFCPFLLRRKYKVHGYLYFRKTWFAHIRHNDMRTLGTLHPYRLFEGFKIDLCWAVVQKKTKNFFFQFFQILIVFE